MSRINELDEFIKIAKTECHFPSEHGLTREESASIYLYTMDWGDQSLYRLLNEALRVKDRSVLVPWHGYLKLLYTALQKLPSLKQNLWRGVNGDITKNYKEDEELTWWSFNSCSSAIKVVENFLGSVSTLLMIEAKNGKLISAYSNFPQENEVILGLGTRLRVVSDALNHASLKVIHLVELSDENNEELSSSLATMSVSQPVKTAASKYLFAKHLLTDDCLFIFCEDAPISNKTSTFKVHTYANGSRYEGEWTGEKRHGKGTFYYFNGEKYTGDWVDNQKAGEGVYSWPDGDRYEGQYKDDRKNGKGTYYFVNGNKYTGDWIDEKRVGQGVCTWTNGARYEGQFKDDKQNGKGTYYFVNGNKYTGDWVDNQQSGQGVYSWPNGDRYEMRFSQMSWHHRW
jgi:hypothetical protein